MKDMAVLLITLVVLSEFYLQSQSLVLHDQPLTVYVDGVRGNNSLKSSSKDNPCKSLSFVANNLTQKHLVHIEILGESLKLTEPVDFINFSNITLFGSLSSTTIGCTDSDAGVAFVNVSNLSLHSLVIENCGALRPSTSFEYGAEWMNLNLSVALYILNCTDVSILNVSSHRVVLDFHSMTQMGL